MDNSEDKPNRDDGEVKPPSEPHPDDVHRTRSRTGSRSLPKTPLRRGSPPPYKHSGQTVVTDPEKQQRENARRLGDAFMGFHAKKDGAKKDAKPRIVSVEYFNEERIDFHAEWLKKVSVSGVDQVYKDKGFHSMEDKYLHAKKMGLTDLGKAAKTFIQKHFEHKSRKQQKKEVQQAAINIYAALEKLDKGLDLHNVRIGIERNLVELLNIKSKIDQSPNHFQSRLSTLIDMMVRETVTKTGVSLSDRYSQEKKLHDSLKKVNNNLDKEDRGARLEVKKEVKGLEKVIENPNTHPFTRVLCDKINKAVGSRMEEDQEPGKRPRSG